MIRLPWSKKSPTAEELRRTEEVKLLKKMGQLDPNSEEYSQLLVRYEHLSAVSLNERKLKEARLTQVIDACTTGAMMGVTLTAEQWTPLTSKWYNSLMRPKRTSTNFDF